jgi:hypothetical protein
VRTWLGGLLRGLLHGIDRALGAHNPFQTALGFGVIFAGFALLGWGSYLLVRSYARGPGRRARRDPPAGDVAGGVDSAALRAAALNAARAGRYREATALLFGWVVRVLDERGRVAFDPARTPGEYRRMVRDPLFDELAGAAVVAVFAPGEPSAELFERINAACEHFLASAGR